jgi:hypothetical protein
MTAPGRGRELTPADFVSRCALGIDRGDWFYLYDKAGELAAGAQRLSQLAHQAY